MKTLTLLLLLLLTCTVSYAYDTEVHNIELTPAAYRELHKFKDVRIKGVSYWVAEKKVVFVSEQPLLTADLLDLADKIKAFVPQDTVKEAQLKALKNKGKNLTHAELVDLLKLKGELQ